MCIFSLFWVQTLLFKANIYSFLINVWINFLLPTLKCTETLCLYFFCQWKYEKISLKSRISIFSKIFSSFINCRAKTKPNLKWCFIKIAHHATYIQWLWSQGSKEELKENGSLCFNCLLFSTDQIDSPPSSSCWLVSSTF